MNQRLKGQDSQFYMTQGATQLSQFDSIKDFELAYKLELKEEGYVGETTDRYDDIFHGVSGSFMAHITSGAVYDIIQAIIDRARRRVPGISFSAKTTLQFPSGERKRIVVPDIFFAEIPNVTGGRDEYSSLKFSFGASTGRFI